MGKPARGFIQATAHPVAAQYSSDWKLLLTHLQKTQGSPWMQHHKITLVSSFVRNYCSLSHEQDQVNPSTTEQEVLHQQHSPQHWLSSLPAWTQLRLGEQMILPFCAGCHHFGSTLLCPRQCNSCHLWLCPPGDTQENEIIFTKLRTESFFDKLCIGLWCRIEVSLI